MIEVLPVGVTCNLRCDYCYEQAERDKQPVHKYDREQVLKGLETSQGFWQVFGGEPLLLRFEDLDELLTLGCQKWGYTGIQTNGTLITPKHIELFIRCNTQVGISVDGPGELNDSRWAGTLEATRAATAKTEWAIDELARLTREGNQYVGPTIITTLHAGNVSEPYWPRFEQWLRYLDSIGVHYINLHFMELDHKASKWNLSNDDLTQVMMKLWDLSMELKTLKFLNFEELVKLLRGQDYEAMCLWRGCDPWSTSAVQGLNNEGEPSNCTRGTKDGVDWLPAEGDGETSRWQIGDFTTNRNHERQLALYVTPDEHGGCQGCRFWMMCQGYCPGTGDAVDAPQEWRVKSSHCRSIKAQFTEVEKRLRAVGETPVSVHPKRTIYEAYMYNEWKHGRHATMSEAIRAVENQNVVRS